MFQVLSNSYPQVLTPKRAERLFRQGGEDQFFLMGIPMADTSSSLSLPFILPNQAQKHVTHNEALRILDVLVQLAVVSDDLATPPGTPADGTRYIVGDGGTGDWAGHDGEVALYETGGWRFFVPRAGWRAFVVGREALIAHDGTDWIDLDSAEVQEIDAFGLGMIAPAATPFSAKLNAALWTALYDADGGTGGLIKTLNKETSADDVGFVFQQDFQTRALIGLFGNDNLRFSTSPDGTTFFDGLTIDVATGVVEQPRLPRFKGTTNFDNYAAADAWTKISINDLNFNDQSAFNATNNTFVAPTAGTYHLGGTLTYKANTAAPTRSAGRLVLNSATEINGSRAAITSVHIDEVTSVVLQDMIALAAGDTVELQGRFTGADGYFMADRSAFWGYKVG